MNKIHKRIENQKIALILDFIMWGIAASLLTLKEDRECETFYTDAEVIGYNPDFASTMNDHEIRFILAHEVLHVLLGHCFRAVGKAKKEWNEACDYVVNLLLIDAGFIMPACALYKEKYRDMSAEEIYYLLVKEAQKSQPKSLQRQEGQSGEGQQNGKSSQNGSRSDKQNDGIESKGNSSESETGTENETDTDIKTGADTESDNSSPKTWGEIRPNANADAAKKWANQAMQAALQAHQRGKLPGSLRRVVLEANAPYVDFKSLTINFVQNLAPTDYTWSRGNRNYLVQGFYAPTLRDNKLGKMFWGNDTSGSVSEFQMSCSEKFVQSLMNDCRPSSLTVLHADADIRSVEVYETYDDIKLTPIGGGGTDFRPVFEYIEKTGEQPAGLIFLTDLEGVFPENEPDYPVLWLSTKRNAKAPFGETVYLDLRGE